MRHRPAIMVVAVGGISADGRVSVLPLLTVSDGQRRRGVRERGVAVDDILSRRRAPPHFQFAAVFRRSKHAVNVFAANASNDANSVMAIEGGASRPFVSFSWHFSSALWKASFGSASSELPSVCPHDGGL